MNPTFDFNDPDTFDSYTLECIDFQMSNILKAVMMDQHLVELQSGNRWVCHGTNIHLNNVSVCFPRSISRNSTRSLGAAIAKYVLDCGATDADIERVDVDEVKNILESWGVKGNVLGQLDLMREYPYFDPHVEDAKSNLFELVRTIFTDAGLGTSSAFNIMSDDINSSSPLGVSAVFTSTPATAWHKQVYDYTTGRDIEDALNLNVSVPSVDMVSDFSIIVEFWATILNITAHAADMAAGDLVINFACATVKESDVALAEIYLARTNDLGGWVQTNNQCLPYPVMKPFCAMPVNCADTLFTDYVSHHQLMSNDLEINLDGDK